MSVYSVFPAPKSPHSLAGLPKAALVGQVGKAPLEELDEIGALVDAAIVVGEQREVVFFSA